MIKDNNSTNFYENDGLATALPLQQLFATNPAAIPQNFNELSKTLLSLFNNGTNTSLGMPPLPPMPSSMQSLFHSQHSLASSANKAPSQTSNDDSLDSQFSGCNGDENERKKMRCRRRKPQKTTRLSNDSQLLDFPAQFQVPSTENGVSINSSKDNVHDTNGSNVAGFSTFHPNSSDGAHLTAQTQSIDLSNHSASHSTCANSIASIKSGPSESISRVPLPEENMNGNEFVLPSNIGELNGMNGSHLYASMNFNHLGLVGNGKTNPLEFSNTADLVKKVEELVKCNVSNGLDCFNTQLPKKPRPENEDDEKLGANNGNHLQSSANSLVNGNSNIACPNVPFADRTINDDLSVLKNASNGVIGDHKNISSKMNEQAISNGDNDELPLLPTATAKIPEIATFANSTPKQNQSIEETEANLEKMFSDMEDNNQSSSFDETSILKRLEDSETEPSDRSSSDANGLNKADATKDSEQKETNSNSNSTSNRSSQNTNGKSRADSQIDASKSKKQDALPTNSSDSNANTSQADKKKAAPATTSKKRNVQRNGKRNSKVNKKKSFGTGGGNSVVSGNKKAAMNGKIEKSDKKVKAKDESNNENAAKFRGPYIHIQKDGTEVVINAPISEEIAEKQNKLKKSITLPSVSDRSKVRGLHVSTLSHKYDADTTDISWMCVFCKLGPHKYGLGDLFGPFILSTESEEFQLSQIDPSEDVFKSHRTKANMVATKGMLVVPAKRHAAANAHTVNVNHATLHFDVNVKTNFLF